MLVIVTHPGNSCVISKAGSVDNSNVIGNAGNVGDSKAICFCL